jgi:N-acetylneuraminic acid mutarotase
MKDGIMRARSLSPLSAFLLGCAGLLSACEENGELTIKTYVPVSIAGVDTNENVFNLAANIRVQVVQDGEVTREEVFAANEDSGRIGVLPFDGELQIKIFAENDNGTVIGRGGSSKLRLRKQDSGRTVGVFVGQEMTFFPTTDGDAQVVSTMSQGRVGHTATEIDNGFILIAGGTDASGGQLTSGTLNNTLEVFDPATGRYAVLAAKFSEPRAFHTATRLPDGKVLFVGGLTQSINGSISASDTMDLFDPATCGNPFNAATCEIKPLLSQLQSERGAHIAALLPGGRVLVAGGFQRSGLVDTYLKTAEIVNPAEDAVAPAGQMPEARGFAAAATLPNGKIVISGGRDSTTATDSILLFTDGVGFSQGGTMAARRFSHTMNPIGSKKDHLMIAGGFTQVNGAGGAVPSPTLDLIDPEGQIRPEALAFLPGGSIAGHMAATTEDGQVLVFGGGLTNGNATDSAVLVNLAQQVVLLLNPKETFDALEFTRLGAAAVGHSSGMVFFFGGVSVSNQGTELLSSGEAFIGELLE